MPDLTFDLLLGAVSPGGPSCLSSATELAAAGGAHCAVAPAKFVRGRGRDAVSVYAYERRFLDGVLRHTVIIDSKQSQLNRAESALWQAVTDGHPLLGRLPHVRVVYERDGAQEVFADLTLPHRVYDGHVRAGTVDGQPVTDSVAYRAIRDATPANARPVLETSPITLAYGGWDATRPARQGRWRSALVGEIVGFLAGDDKEPPDPIRRGGARVDPVGMQVQLTPEALVAIADQQRSELSRATYDNAVRRHEPSRLGLGGIPPILDQLGGVACDRILRTHVLSFATLRQIRFGAGPEGDAACRALLAALALAGLSRADTELYLRANCDLVEVAPATVRLDQRNGKFLDLPPLTPAATDVLLAAALDHAEQAAGIHWIGVALEVTGNPDVVRGAVAADEGDAA